MSRTVFCRKYKQELEGMKFPPYPGEKGQKLFDSVSQKAWQEWLQLQTLLINEKRLNLTSPEAQTYLSEQLEKFLDNEEVDRAEGYVPPSE